MWPSTLRTPADFAVVVGVPSVTSTATSALAAGHRSVLCAETIEVALELRMPGRVLTAIGRLTSAIRSTSDATPDHPRHSR